jgi:hypothetical protein
MASTLPCLTSEHGYRVFSLAEMRMLDGAEDPWVIMPLVPGCRLVPSPYSGMGLATNVCYRTRATSSTLFTGACAPLPDLPVPFSEWEPVGYHPDDEPRPGHRQRARVGLDPARCHGGVRRHSLLPHARRRRRVDVDAPVGMRP